MSQSLWKKEKKVTYNIVVGNVTIVTNFMSLKCYPIFSEHCSSHTKYLQFVNIVKAALRVWLRCNYFVGLLSSINDFDIVRSGDFSIMEIWIYSSLQAYVLCCFIGLEPRSVLLFEVSGLILSDVNLGGLI